jgi:hypothetical protein
LAFRVQTFANLRFAPDFFLASEITSAMASFQTFAAALCRGAFQFERKRLWNNQPVYVEIWLEKDALSGVLYQETAAWDVPLMVTKGYPSVSYLHDAAETIIGHGKPTYIYYVGDWDPSGLDITRATEAGLWEYAPNAQIHFERIAVTKEQIITMGLPTRPTKKKDSRSKNFSGESVEVEAIDPNDLQRIVRSVITQHVDSRLLRETREQEERDRELLKIMPKGW